MDESQLRKAVIRLAHEKPELQKHLLPLVTAGADQVFRPGMGESYDPMIEAMKKAPVGSTLTYTNANRREVQAVKISMGWKGSWRIGRKKVSPADIANKNGGDSVALRTASAEKSSTVSDLPSGTKAEFLVNLNESEMADVEERGAASEMKELWKLREMGWNRWQREQFSKAVTGLEKTYRVKLVTSKVRTGVGGLRCKVESGLAKATLQRMVADLKRGHGNWAKTGVQFFWWGQLEVEAGDTGDSLGDDGWNPAEISAWLKRLP